MSSSSLGGKDSYYNARSALDEERRRRHDSDFPCLKGRWRWRQPQPQHRHFRSSTGAAAAAGKSQRTVDEIPSPPPNDDDERSLVDSLASYVYESPLGNLVTRLRTVSLVTGICGSIGLPLIVSIKGGDIPSTGLLAVGMAFVGGTVGSTAVVHYVFRPYVYSIERIPVRQCHYKPPSKEEGSRGGEGKCAADASATTEPASSKKLSSTKDTLYKAVTKSLFLNRVETVFDTCDVAPYKGMRPLCNFSAKGVPMYVHAEYLFGADLRDAANLNADNKKQPKVVDPGKDDDDFF